MKTTVLTCPTKDCCFLFASQSGKIAIAAADRYYLRLKEGKSTRDETAYLSQSGLIVFFFFFLVIKT